MASIRQEVNKITEETRDLPRRKNSKIEKKKRIGADGGVHGRTMERERLKRD